MCFFKVKHSIGHISGMVGPIDVKWKGRGSVGYWVNYVMLTCDLTHDVDLCFFQGQISKWLYFRNCYLIDVKQKGCKSIRYWADCMVLPSDYTHDLDLVVSRSKIEIALFEKWDGWFIWNEKDASRSFMTVTYENPPHLWVTMVGWVHVPDSDWGDFRCRRAVDKSSCESYVLCWNQGAWHSCHNT